MSTPLEPRDRFVDERLPPPDLRPLMRYDLADLHIAERSNLVDTLMERAASKGWLDRPFLRSQRMTLTYREADERVRRIAQVLVEDFALVPGNRVLLRGGNSIGMALAWLGVVKAGLVAVASMPLLRAKELREIIQKCQPSLALCDGALLDELQAAQEASEPARALKAIVPFNLMDEPGSLAVRASAKNGEFARCNSHADDIAMMAFTSGTTGSPKAALHSHRDILAACAAWPTQVLKATPDDIVIGSPPLAFTFGLGGLLIFPMWAGASVYYPSKPYTPQSMLETMHEVGATISYTAPTFYRQMAPLARAQRPTSLRISVSAGEALPQTTRQLWLDATGIDMMDGIGATEMFHIFISSVPGQTRLGAIGQVVPGYTAKVVDEQGQEVQRGTVGKLAVIGPTGCRYLDDERQRNYVKAGWNHPGDAFTQDADGYFFYQARADDMIISAGYNIGGPEVEDALLTHPAVAECGVIGVADEERGMVVKAFVVLKSGHLSDEAMVKALQEHVKATIAPYKYPRQVQFMTSLPRTETGKLQRFKLRQGLA